MGYGHSPYREQVERASQESIVVPNMDDISFFDTRTMPLRGVIFADAAKKSDLLRAELDGTSATATGPSDPSGASTQQDRDGKSTPGSTKTSDLLAANKVGTASAPVSGAATPCDTRTSSASTLRTTLTDEDSEASAVNAGNQSSAALRNRKSGLDAAQAARTTSPAAAGLSDLLSRDAAAGGGSLGERLASGSPPLDRTLRAPSAGLGSVLVRNPHRRASARRPVFPHSVSVLVR